MSCDESVGTRWPYTCINTSSNAHFDYTMSKSSSRYMNRVLVHPIRSPDDKVIPSGRLQDGPGRVWTEMDVGQPPKASDDLDLCPMASKLGP